MNPEFLERSLGSLAVAGAAILDGMEDPRLARERRIEAILADVLARHRELRVQLRGNGILPPDVAEQALRDESRTDEANELARLVDELGW